MNEKATTERMVDSHMRVRLEVSTYQQFQLIATVRGIKKHELLAEAIREYVSTYTREVNAFTEKVSQDGT